MKSSERFRGGRSGSEDPDPGSARPTVVAGSMVPLLRRLQYVARVMETVGPAQGQRLVWMGPDGRVQEAAIPGEGTVEIGRGPDTSVALNDPRLSRRHFRIASLEALVEILDLKSRNGTRVNGRRVTREFLRDGDVIEAGRLAFVFLER